VASAAGRISRSVPVLAVVLLRVAWRLNINATRKPGT
jgi:hypothetical protein